jgi:hypothetical protein
MQSSKKGMHSAVDKRDGLALVKKTSIFLSVDLSPLFAYLAFGNEAV